MLYVLGKGVCHRGTGLCGSPVAAVAANAVARGLPPHGRFAHSSFVPFAWQQAHLPLPMVLQATEYHHNILTVGFTELPNFIFF